MWRLWFHGDARTDNTPYRDYEAWGAYNKLRAHGRRVMSALTQIATTFDYSLALTEAMLPDMAEVDLMRVFDLAFDAFAIQFEPSTQSLIRPTKKYTSHAVAPQEFAS
ncbi:Aste57867_5627 [Aphanomyces stellatus]|uniref:Aste57867_5627 protein n=1 Tax=Aphanomyces stellatus TaxID=120398 RepID=A0A485KEG3_9STRA|nr:hypothetical protein As57867_005614 [Aphanomyces stellatus]VFT82673.1 Aste57867_5627 [Aphanomyces stellatus]